MLLKTKHTIIIIATLSIIYVTSAPIYDDKYPAYKTPKGPNPLEKNDKIEKKRLWYSISTFLWNEDINGTFTKVVIIPIRNWKNIKIVKYI